MAIHHLFSLKNDKGAAKWKAFDVVGNRYPLRPPAVDKSRTAMKENGRQFIWNEK